MKDRNAEFISANAVRYAKNNEVKEYFNVNFVYHNERNADQILCASVRCDSLDYESCKNYTRGDRIYVIWCEDSYHNLRLEHIERIFDTNTEN